MKQYTTIPIEFSIPKPGEGEPVFTAEQIVSALKNPEIVTAVTSHLSSETGGNYLIMSKDDQSNAINMVKDPSTQNGYTPNGFITTLRETIGEYDIKPKVRNIHDKYDEQLQPFGVTRKNGESTYKALDNFLTTQKNRITELENAVQSGAGDEQLKSLNQELQSKLNGFEDEARVKIQQSEDKYKDLQDEYNKLKLGSVVDNVYADISKKFKPEKELGEFFGAHKKEVLNYAKSNQIEQDGKTYITNPDGSIKKTDSYEPVTVEMYLNKEFEKAILHINPVSGPGGDPQRNSNINPSSITADNFDIADVKTQSDLMKRMQGFGLKKGTVQFTEIWGKFSKGLPFQ